MRALKTSFKAKLMSAIVLTVLFLALTPNLSPAQDYNLESVGSTCDTYCHWYNPNYNCIVTNSSGFTVTCYNRNSWIGEQIPL